MYSEEELRLWNQGDLAWISFLLLSGCVTLANLVNLSRLGFLAQKQEWKKNLQHSDTLQMLDRCNVDADVDARV